MKKLICFLIFITIGCMVYGRETIVNVLYVSPQGKDVNKGTADSPLATLNAALKQARDLRNQAIAPIEIRVAGGNYLLDSPVLLTYQDSGTDAAPLVIRGDEKDKPVLSGGIELPPFEKVSDNLWRTFVPDVARFNGSFHQLFVNGKRAVLARTPDEGRLYKAGSVTETVIDKDKDNRGVLAVQKIKLTGEQCRALNRASDRGQVIVSINHAWDRTRKFVERFSPADSSLYIVGRPMASWNKLNNSSQFIFENSMSFLDASGEWFLDPSGMLYYIPRQGETIENSRAVVPVLDKLLVVSGEKDRKVKNITIENLIFRYSSHAMPREGNEPNQAAALTPATVSIDYADNIKLYKCEIASTGNNAIWFNAGCTNSSLTCSYLHDLGIGGVKIGSIRIPEDSSLLTHTITIDNNIIRSGGHEVPTGVGVIIFQSSDNVISHNEIADFNYSGVSVGWVWGYSYSPSKRNKIIYNHIHHLGWGKLSDMGGVYTLGPSEGTVVSNNVIHDVYSYGYGGWGLYTDEGSTAIVMENNLVYGCKSSAFHQHYGKENIIRNNIFVNQIRAQLEATRVEPHLSFTFSNNIIYYTGAKLFDMQWQRVKCDADYNCYYNSPDEEVVFGKLSLKEWRKVTGKDKHSIVANPEFADIHKGDFSIKNKSVLAKIRFTPFDYTRAGVYGDKDWVRLAAFSPERAAEFANTVKRLEEEKNPDR